TGHDIKFAPDAQSIAVATLVFVSNGDSPITVYQWNDSTGFGTKYADPSTFVENTAEGVAYSADGSAIFLAHNWSPYISAYPWNNSTGFGTKYADPSTPVPG